MLNLEKILGFLLAFAISITCSSAQGLQKFSLKRPALGTTVNITCYASDSLLGMQAMRRAFDHLDSLNAIFSDYDPSSEVLQIAANYSRSAEIQVSRPLYDLIQRASDIRNLTDGKFNIAVGALTNLWRHWLAKDKVPPKRMVRKFKRHLNSRSLKLIPPDRICFKRKNMRLDFGGIAKGYIGDQMAGIMRENGVDRFLIDLGGDLIAGEAPPGVDSWTITISWCQKIIKIVNQAVATSGPDFQFFIYRGERFAHIIDPATGWGVTNQFGSTVIAATGTEADALASAFSILSMHRTSEILNRKADIAAIIGRDNELIQSDNFSSYVESRGHTN